MSRPGSKGAGVLGAWDPTNNNDNNGNNNTAIIITIILLLIIIMTVSRSRLGGPPHARGKKIHHRGKSARE